MLINKDLIKLGGNGLLFQNTMSVYQVLLPVYPAYDWLPWKFDKCPLLYFEDIVNQRKFMHWAANELKINDLEDWYKVDADVYIFLLFVCLKINKGVGEIGRWSNGAKV